MELTIHAAVIKVSKTMLSNANYVELEIASQRGGSIALAIYGSAEQAAVLLDAFPKSEDFIALDGVAKAA